MIKSPHPLLSCSVVCGLFAGIFLICSPLFSTFAMLNGPRKIDHLNISTKRKSCSACFAWLASQGTRPACPALPCPVIWEMPGLAESRSGDGGGRLDGRQAGSKKCGQCHIVETAGSRETEAKQQGPLRVRSCPSFLCS